MTTLNRNVTAVLRRVNDGEPEAVDDLMGLVYTELREVAHAYLVREKALSTLDTRALIHEAYLRLFGKADIEWKNRKHFFVLAARSMRRIICDYVRHMRADKRGGGDLPLPLTALARRASSLLGHRALRSDMLLTLQHVLEQLHTTDPLMARIIDLRFFYGMTIPETADALRISTRSVNREWRLARAMLYNRLAETTMLRELEEAMSRAASAAAEASSTGTITAPSTG